MPKIIYVPTSDPNRFFEVGTLTPGDILQIAGNLHASRRQSTIRNAKDAGVSSEALYAALQAHDTRPCRFGDIISWFQTAEGQIDALLRGRASHTGGTMTEAFAELKDAGVDPTTALAYVLDIANIPRPAAKEADGTANPTEAAVGTA